MGLDDRVCVGAVKVAQSVLLAIWKEIYPCFNC